jgi:hypothetical protein
MAQFKTTLAEQKARFERIKETDNRDYLLDVTRAGDAVRRLFGCIDTGWITRCIPSFAGG